MKRIRSFIVVLALGSTAIGVAVAQQDKPKDDAAAVPAGHERFFKELAALAKKYPKSAARFRIVDAEGKSGASHGGSSHGGSSTPTGSFHACCEWTLDVPRKCVEQCLE